MAVITVRCYNWFEIARRRVINAVEVKFDERLTRMEEILDGHVSGQ
jgi:hypothetical protein